MATQRHDRIPDTLYQTPPTPPTQVWPNPIWGVLNLVQIIFAIKFICILPTYPTQGYGVFGVYPRGHKAGYTLDGTLLFCRGHTEKPGKPLSHGETVTPPHRVAVRSDPQNPGSARN